MNKQEYRKTVDPRKDPIYKKVHEELGKWKKENNITERCIVHHRDDTEEVRAYNEAHYERWGFDEDGNFTEGKYVQFLTRAEHARHHRTGKMLSDITKEKISAANKGRYVSAETRAKLSTVSKGENNPMYGKHHTKETKEKISIINKEKMKGINKGDKNPFYGKTHDEETLKTIREKCSAQIHHMQELYYKYKQQGGNLQWNAFQKAYTNNEIIINQ